MNGYVILNAENKRLSSNKYWTSGDGWVWSEEEMNTLLSECRAWQIKPAFIQHAYVNRHSMDVVVIGEPIKVVVL